MTQDDIWEHVRWTEARQVVALMGDRPGDTPAPEPEVTPSAHFSALVDGGRADDALMFLGHALPRLEALHWACAVLEDEAGRVTLPRAERQALDQALRWRGDPGDAHRRATYRAGQAAGAQSPERMLATAVFLSGGSISEPGLPPVLARPELAGRYAAIAVRLAAQRHDHPPALQRVALDLGGRIAAQGLEALPPR